MAGHQLGAGTGAHPSPEAEQAPWILRSVYAAHQYAQAKVAGQCSQLSKLTDGRKRAGYNAAATLQELRNTKVRDTDGRLVAVITEAEAAEWEEKIRDALRACALAQGRDRELTETIINKIVQAAYDKVGTRSMLEPPQPKDWAAQPEHTAYRAGVEYAQAIYDCAWDSGQAATVLVGAALVAKVVRKDTVLKATPLSTYQLAGAAGVSPASVSRALRYFVDHGLLRPCLDEHDQGLIRSARNDHPAKPRVRIAKRYETTFPHGHAARKRETVPASETGSCLDFTFAALEEALGLDALLKLVAVWTPKQLRLLPALPPPGEYWSHTSVGVAKDDLRKMLSLRTMPNQTKSTTALSWSLVTMTDEGMYRTNYHLDELMDLPVTRAWLAERERLAAERKTNLAARIERDKRREENRKARWKDEAERWTERALFFVDDGWFVFAVEAPRELTRKVAPDNGKRPLRGSNGEHDATQDPELIRRWAFRNPEYNLALACGPSSRDVLDLDVYFMTGRHFHGKAVHQHDGDDKDHTHDAPYDGEYQEEWGKVLADDIDPEEIWAIGRAGWGITSDTDRLHRSPTGGVHAIFQARADRRLQGNAKGPDPIDAVLKDGRRVRLKLDLKGSSGYIVAPGSKVCRPDPEHPGQAIWRKYSVWRDGELGTLNDHDLDMLPTVLVEGNEAGGPVADDGEGDRPGPEVPQTPAPQTSRKYEHPGPISDEHLDCRGTAATRCSCGRILPDPGSPCPDCDVPTGDDLDEPRCAACGALVDARAGTCPSCQADVELGEEGTIYEFPAPPPELPQASGL